jgi:hypothetical protein
MGSRHCRPSCLAGEPAKALDQLDVQYGHWVTLDHDPIKLNWDHDQLLFERDLPEEVGSANEPWCLD